MLGALVALPLGAGTAAAHGGEHEAPGTDQPRVLSVEPAVSGLGVTVVEGGLRLRIDNGTTAPVRVRAPVDVPGGSEPTIGPGATSAVTDTRLDAPAWTLPLLVGDVPVTVSGDRVRPDPPDPVPWWALTLSAALFTFALGTAAAERGPRSRPGIALGAVTLLVVTAYVVHVLGSVRVLAAPPGIATTLGAAGPAIACGALGVLGAALTVTARPLGLQVCTTAGALAALLTVFDAAAFHRAVLAFGWAYDLDRATTVVTLGCGAGLFATGFVLLSRVTATAPTVSTQ